jgi:hypothetical protein
MRGEHVRGIASIRRSGASPWHTWGTRGSAREKDLRSYGVAWWYTVLRLLASSVGFGHLTTPMWDAIASNFLTTTAPPGDPDRSGPRYLDGGLRLTAATHRKG